MRRREEEMMGRWTWEQQDLFGSIPWQRESNCSLSVSVIVNSKHVPF
jgi:hypothetical protein